MDEPLSNLDAKLRGQMRAELKRLQHDLGTTTIYVTHDQVEAMTLAHRVAVMNAGVLQQVGPPKEIYENPANLFVAGFVGAPPMNFVDGEIEGGMFRSAHGSLPMPGHPPRQGVVLGFRPEDARITDEPESFAASVYSSEMPGNETIVTCLMGSTHVVIKAGKEFHAPPDTRLRIAPDPRMVRLFDSSAVTGCKPEAPRVGRCLATASVVGATRPRGDRLLRSSPSGPQGSLEVPFEFRRAAPPRTRSHGAIPAIRASRNRRACMPSRRDEGSPGDRERYPAGRSAQLSGADYSAMQASWCRYGKSPASAQNRTAPQRPSGMRIPTSTDRLPGSEILPGPGAFAARA